MNTYKILTYEGEVVKTFIVDGKTLVDAIQNGKNIDSDLVVFAALMQKSEVDLEELS